MLVLPDQVAAHDAAQDSDWRKRELWAALLDLDVRGVHALLFSLDSYLIVEVEAVGPKLECLCQLVRLLECVHVVYERSVSRVVFPDLEHALEQLGADAHFVASIESLIHDEYWPRPQTEVSDEPHRLRARDPVDSELRGGTGRACGNEEVQVAIPSGFPVRDSVTRTLARHRGQTGGGLVLKELRLGLRVGGEALVVELQLVVVWENVTVVYRQHAVFWIFMLFCFGLLHEWNGNMQ